MAIDNTALEAIDRLHVAAERLGDAECEWQAVHKLPIRLANRLKMQDVRIIHGRGRYTADGRRLVQATMRSTLLRPQRQRIGDTDIIAEGKVTSSGARDYIAVEVSSTVRWRDVPRARNSAEYLQAVFGIGTRAVVSGYAIGEEDHERAVACGVSVILLESNA